MRYKIQRELRWSDGEEDYIYVLYINQDFKWVEYDSHYQLERVMLQMEEHRANDLGNVWYFT